MWKKNVIWSSSGSSFISRTASYFTISYSWGCCCWAPRWPAFFFFFLSDKGLSLHSHPALPWLKFLSHTYIWCPSLKLKSNSSRKAPCFLQFSFGKPSCHLSTLLSLKKSLKFIFLVSTWRNADITFKCASCICGRSTGRHIPFPISVWRAGKSTQSLYGRSWYFRIYDIIC